MKTFIGLKLTHQSLGRAFGDLGRIFCLHLRKIAHSCQVPFFRTDKWS